MRGGQARPRAPAAEDTPAARSDTVRPMAATVLGERFAEGLAYAFELHRDQRRKGSHRPYFAHLIGVSALVLEHDGDEDQAIAGLLHDALEDRGDRTSGAELERRFGGRVRRIVEACSDTQESPKPPWKERKLAYLEHLEHADGDALLVSLADKLYNARTIADDLLVEGELVWKRFGAGREGQLWYYGELARVFSRRLPGVMAARLAEVVSELERATPR